MDVMQQQQLDEINEEYSNDMNELRSGTVSPDYDYIPLRSPTHSSNAIKLADMQPPPNMPLQECPICARTFVPETLVKHIGICEKMASKKRRIFDSSRQRREGTDLAVYLPKNYGLPHKQSTLSLASTPTAVSASHHKISDTAKNSQPKTIQRKSESTSTPINERKENSLTKSNYSLSRETPKAVRRVSAPQNEKCPFCDRCFGNKAYERHVEWCKEKSLICKNNNANMSSAAKERLEARTKYRAPNLKAKRQTVREKYGSLSCSGSTSSLADIGTPSSAMTTSLTSENFIDSLERGFSYNDDIEIQEYYDKFLEESEQKQKPLVKPYVSMLPKCSGSGRNVAGSVKVKKSTRGLFDRYDPFLSAKRQLEELYSPTSSANTSAKTATPSPQTNDPKIRSNSISNPMNNSMRRGEISNLSTARSTFRRTASLRMPNKMSKPLFAQAMKPTIQRGISDEGPISPNFLKSSEYDELPVRTSFNAIQTARNSPPKEIHKPILRDTRCVINRKQNLNLDIRSPSQMLSHSLQLPQYPISKTDSLAVFLKYENEVDVTGPPQVASPPKSVAQMPQVMTEKDLKDKSNILNKRSSMPKEDAKETPILLSKNNSSDSSCGGMGSDDSEKYDVQKLPEIFNNMNSLNRTNSNNSVNSSFTPKTGPIKLDPINRNNKNTSLTNMLFERSNDIIKKDQLDNINASDSSGSDTKALSDDKFDKTISNSQTSSKRNLFDPPEKEQDNNEEERLCSKRQEPERPMSLYKTQNSIDRRSTLGRQLKLNKDNILFDTSPDLDFYSDNMDKAISHVDSMESLNIKKFDDTESMFDDFDLEEFITSFEDDERFPIFKDYKNILLSRALSNSSNTNTLLRSESYNSNKNNEVGDERQTLDDTLVSSPEIKPPVLNDNPVQNDNKRFEANEDPSPSSESDEPKAATNNNDYNYQMYMEDLSPAEKDLLKSVQELDQMCESASTMLDSDELSSMEGYPVIRQTVSKLSADSAYGSLSRQSPSERPLNRSNNLNKSRQHLHQPQPALFETEHFESSKTTKQQQRQTNNRMLRENTSLSSSGSESSLPPISQKMELHPHAEKNSAAISKFCHECGSKYIVAQAKFCMECGVRRITVD